MCCPIGSTIDKGKEVTMSPDNPSSYNESISAFESREFEPLFSISIFFFNFLQNTFICPDRPKNHPLKFIAVFFSKYNLLEDSLKSMSSCLVNEIGFSSLEIHSLFLVILVN